MAGTFDPFAGTTLSTRCYESHPILKLGKGKLYGGSARFPVIKNADVYVVLQSGDLNGWQSDPWDEQEIIEVQYAIRDMGVPGNVQRFKKLVTWLCNQLQKGKTVHVGCIGGHGRTGTVLSAVVAEALKKKDAIQYVRKHYCKKAVESKEQVKFLMKHYGVLTAEGAKEGLISKSFAEFAGSKPNQPLLVPSLSLAGEAARVRVVKPEGVSTSTKSYTPIESSRSLWKPKK